MSRWSESIAERVRQTIYAGQLDIFGNEQPETVHLDERLDLPHEDQEPRARADNE